jgi:non-homologous end joining protein Ku
MSFFSSLTVSVVVDGILEKLIEAKSKGQEIVPKQEEKEPEETTDIIEALKASLKVKGKSSTSTAAKARGKMGIAVSK